MLDKRYFKIRKCLDKRLSTPVVASTKGGENSVIKDWIKSQL